MSLYDLFCFDVIFIRISCVEQTEVGGEDDGGDYDDDHDHHDDTYEGLT